jgi:hypothetical protein
MDTWTVILWGAAGGVVPDILRLIRDRHGDQPAYLRHWQYYLGLVLMVVIGAVVAWLFAPARTVDAIAYGIAAPSILEGLAADKSKESRLSGDGNIIDIWRYWWSR